MIYRLSCLLLLFVVHTKVFAQIPFYTILDTAEMRANREQKLHFRFTIDQPYDSVSGKLLKNGLPDTTWTEFDKLGRETGFSYRNDDGTRSFVRYYFNSKGQVVRRFSYDTDSTNGFLDYWTYNNKGQVIREVSCTREGAQEPPFSAEGFEYNDAGVLIQQKFYYVRDGGEKKYDHSKWFYYADGMEIRIRLGKDGDTTYIDTVGGLRNEDPYWSRYYRYVREYDGTARRMLVSSAETTVDTVNDKIREIFTDMTYDYGNGSLESATYDTTYFDFAGNILEIRQALYIEKFFFDAKGELEYTITYNRMMQPITRSTVKYEYYK